MSLLLASLQKRVQCHVSLGLQSLIIVPRQLGGDIDQCDHKVFHVVFRYDWFDVRVNQAPERVTCVLLSPV